jgi:isoleucyl-tRNA synthetase
VAATDYRNEMAVSNEHIKRMGDSYRRIRNTARFMLANLSGFNPATDMVETEQLISLDRWIVGVAADLQSSIIEDYEAYNFHAIYQKVHNFCVNELGGFYLDVIKDRQYTTKTDGLPRRSAQTALYHLIQAFTRWIAPITSFTADEIWSYIPGVEEAESSVFLSQWYTGLIPLSNQIQGDGFWQQILRVKQAVNKALEAQRKAGKVGKSLEAEVTLYCESGLLAQLAQLSDELRFVLLTSKAAIADIDQAPADSIDTEVEGLSLSVASSSAPKCDRCWHHSEDVGTIAAHPELCGRCVTNIDGEGETREFA